LNRKEKEKKLTGMVTKKKKKKTTGTDVK